MKDSAPATTPSGSLQPYLSKLAVWALSVGSAIGWGSLVVTSKNYLSQAGPLGSVLGLLIGFVMMLMVASHYHFLANRYPGTGGLYNYVKYIFGYDRAFLVAWFLFLVYISIFWANATSIPLFVRYFLHNALSIGYLYSLFGYEVYLGEAIVTLIVITLMALLCIKSKTATARSMVVLTLLFTVGITVCFVAAMLGRGKTGVSMAPSFVPGKSALRQVVRIAFISPWAFIGFESVSHSAAEYHFKHTELYRVLVWALVVITALYIFVILMSVSTYPPECGSWLDYIRRLDEFEGIAGLPAFYAAQHYMGNAGVYILMASLLALVLTSLIGTLRAVSRLCYAAAQDKILPDRFAHLNEKQIPVNAILLIVLISLPVPFLGRTAISWIVDTTTIGATILYGFASAAVFKVSRKEGARRNIVISGICLVILVIFLLFLLFPGILSDQTIETETYILLSAWSILGLVFFNYIIRKDHARNFGKAIIVWTALLAFIVVMAMTLAARYNEEKENAVIDDIYHYITQTAAPEIQAMEPADFLEMQRARLVLADNGSVLVILGLFGLSFTVLMFNYSSMKKWEMITAAERDKAQLAAYTDPLTGVKSKNAYSAQESRIEAQIADGTAGAFGIIVCDVNGLKRINDTLGHKAGDDYIRAACRMLCEYFKHSPVFRIGGDEFVVLLQGQDFEARHEILQSFNEKVERHIGTAQVVASLGLADFDAKTDASFHDVFKRADELMYRRKLQLKSMGAVTRD